MHLHFHNAGSIIVNGSYTRIIVNGVNGSYNNSSIIVTGSYNKC